MSLAHITLATRDVAGTSRFFEQTLLWRPIHKPGNIDLTAAWLEVGPGQQLHLLEVPDFAPSPFEAEFGRHIAVFHKGTDFPALQERLAAHGAKLIDEIRALIASLGFAPLAVRATSDRHWTWSAVKG